jgi:hypothetical protein
MAGFRGASAYGSKTYAGVAGADLENAPQGPVPFTSPFGLPITRMQLWHAGGSVPGAGQGVPGQPVQIASGNPAVATRGEVDFKSPYGGGPERTPAQFGNPRPLNVGQESAFRGPGAGVGSENDKLITYDRHLFAKVGYENSGRNSGETDPPMDGPARPSYQVLNRTINYQQGTDADQNQDDLSRDYTRNAQGMYIGEQGTGWAPVYGGVPGLYQPYGSYAGITAGPVQGIQSPVAQGSQGDGPRKVWSGPPHGLHSPTLPAYSQTLGHYMDVPQMHVPRQDRPANSPIAGQSYSQTVKMQGQTGTTPQGVGLNSGALWNQRARGNGWRGRAG